MGTETSAPSSSLTHFGEDSMYFSNAKPRTEDYLVFDKEDAGTQCLFCRVKDADEPRGEGGGHLRNFEQKEKKQFINFGIKSEGRVVLASKETGRCLHPQTVDTPSQQIPDLNLPHDFLTQE
jgi:hypothetical protein